MDETNLELTEVKVEQVILNGKGLRAIRLDAWAMDLHNRQFNIEMQNDATGDDMRKRARFQQGLMDSPILKSGKNTKYKELPATIIIFITQEDIFDKDVAVKDPRIARLDEIVSEVKQSEEWEEVRMNIYDIGMERGMERGMELLNRLNLRLIEDKRYEDMERAARDDEYRDQLFQEYGIEK